MSDTERSLLDAVLENPDDDLPRLVYADFLEEHGDATRAEFIRAQIAVSLQTKNQEYDTDVYQSGIRKIANVTEVDYKRWIDLSEHMICDKESIYYDIRDDYVHVRDMTNYNHFQFRRGFVASIFANVQWCEVRWDSMLQYPLRTLRLQPHLSSKHQIDYEKTSNNFWGLKYVNDEQKVTISLTFDSRIDALHWFSGYLESHRIHEEWNYVQYKAQAIVELRNAIINQSPAHDTGPLDDTFLGDLIDRNRGR